VTPDVVVDIGNSRMKWARVSDGRIAEAVAFEHDDAVGWKRQCELWQLSELTQWAVASVVPRAQGRFEDWLKARAVTAIASITNDLFSDDSPLGFTTRVLELDRVGIDRLLNAFAAWKRTPDRPTSVAISVGTAMTIDLVEARGLHCGGVILPGPRLMAKSLYEHTAQLPVVDLRPHLPLMNWGENTEDAIETGIAYAILGAADQMVWDWTSQRPQPVWVFVTGGDAEYFRGFAFTSDVDRIIIDPTLTLDGIRLAAEALP
jgi:type III pantothenate kinase